MSQLRIVRKEQTSRTSRLLLSAFSVLFGVCSAATAQTLARPGWAGAHISREPWWSHAVLYRIDPLRFQDSDGDGRGDLGGITERLEYLQALGVDAIVLAVPDTQRDPAAANGFDELTRQAASRHLRIIVELPGSVPDTILFAQARFWLNQGAAGLSLNEDALLAIKDSPRTASLLHQLRLMLNSFPGGRVLLAGTSASGATAVDAVHREAQLVLTPAVRLNSVLDARLGLRFASAPETVLRLPEVQSAGDLRLARVAAVVLLASPNPVLIEAGQELGLGSTAQGDLSVMQWTPANVTVAPQTAAEQVAAPQPEFKPFKPYIPPPPRSLVGEAARPVVVETDAPPTVDPALLPGFTTAAGALALAVEDRLAANGMTANVRDEERDPASVLTLYRRLVQLRHDDPALRSGTQVFLDEEAPGVLAWVRRTALETRVVLCNLSTAPLHLSLDPVLSRIKVRGGTLRDLIASGASATNVQPSDNVTLAPGSAMVGRLYR